MKLFIKILLLLYSFAIAQDMQNVKVTKILDTNLFETKTVQKISLANVDSPSNTDKDSSTYRFTFVAKNYARQEIYHAPLQMIVADSSKDVWKVHLFRQYDFQLFNFNEYFLENGYGYYVKEPESDYSEQYFIAAQEANRKKLGLWDGSIIRKRENSFDGRWRLMAGVLGFTERKSMDEIGMIPFFNLNFRVSRILAIGEKRNYLGLASEFGSDMIFLNYYKGGLEIRIDRQFYISAHYGKYWLIFADISDLDNLVSFRNIAIGYVHPINGLEFEISLSNTPIDKEFKLFKAVLAFPL